MTAGRVSLIIPGRDCASTLRECLASVVPLLGSAGDLEEIIFVDDGSTDDSAAIAAEFPVRVLEGGGRGAGAARNVGWRAAAGDLVWFVDADCVAEPDALGRLTPHLADPAVAAVSGSYGIANERSLLARLIHEEIVERHLGSPPDVDFLATFNVLYRRSALVELGGFDERYLKAQDAELSFRAADAGWRLRFEIESRVRHHHEERLRRYLGVQRQQGYWRVWLHREHRGRAGGNSYSSWVDHVQPPLALLAIASAPLAWWPIARWAPIGLVAALLLATLPMTVRLARRTGRAAMLWWAPMNVVRALWRGVGMAQGTLAYIRDAIVDRRSPRELA